MRTILDDLVNCARNPRNVDYECDGCMFDFHLGN